MKKLLIVSFLSLYSFASQYYAKVEPIDSYDIRASVGGVVTFVNNKVELTYIDKPTKIVQIDAKIDKIDLKQSKLKLQNLKEILALEKGTLKSFQKVSSKSKFDKDNQKIKILNIKSNITDIETKIATLEDKISKKVFYENKKYIYNISVKKGDYIAPATLLYTVKDISKAKLTIFISKDELDNIKNKTIYIDDKKTDFKISKLSTIADTTHISSYKCEIELSSPKVFSKLVKVEFK